MNLEELIARACEQYGTAPDGDGRERIVIVADPESQNLYLVLESPKDRLALSADEARALIFAIGNKVRELGGAIRQCGFCGCTSERACAAGCFWVGHVDVCSRCAGLHGE